MIWSELNYIVICLCNNDPDFIFLWNRLLFFRCLLPWVPWQGIIQWIRFTCWKRTFKISCFTHWWWERASRIYLIYKIVRCHKGDSEEYARTYYDGLNNTLLVDLSCRACLLACTKVSGVFSQYVLRSKSLWYPLSSSMLKNMQFFSLIISKFLWLYNLV